MTSASCGDGMQHHRQVADDAVQPHHVRRVVGLMQAVEIKRAAELAGVHADRRLHAFLAPELAHVAPVASRVRRRKRIGHLGARARANSDHRGRQRRQQPDAPGWPRTQQQRAGAVERSQRDQRAPRAEQRQDRKPPRSAPAIAPSTLSE